MTSPQSWVGTRGHITFTIIVFVVLASLDNAAIALLPNMVLPISEALGTSQGGIGAITAVVILVTALTAVGCGYWGDRSSRKRLLIYGTGVWTAGAALSATSGNFWHLLAWQIVTAIGLGSIASVGKSRGGSTFHQRRVLHGVLTRGGFRHLPAVDGATVRVHTRP